MKRIKYSTKEYAFREVICNWLETYDLAKLHYQFGIKPIKAIVKSSLVW